MALPIFLAVMVVMAVVLFRNRNVVRASIITLPLTWKSFKRTMRVLWAFYTGKRDNRTVGRLIEEKAALHPNKVLFYFENDIWSYERVNKLSNQIANYFAAKGYRKGDIVGIVMENCPEEICVWLGLSKIGVISSIVNTNLRYESLRETLLVGKPKATIFHTPTTAGLESIMGLGEWTQDLLCFGASGTVKAKDFMRELEGLSEENPIPRDVVNHGDDLLYLYTSGSTGLPKAVPFRHSRFLISGVTIQLLWDICRDDIMYMFLPLYHAAGGAGGLSVTLTVGASMVLKRKFSASKFWKDVVHHDVTVVQYIGEICRYLLRQPPVPEENQHKVRLFYGNGLREEIWESFVNRFKIPQIGELYAATECNAGLFNIDNTPGTIGFIPHWLFWMVPAGIIKVDEDTGEPIRNPKTGLAIQCQINEPGEWVSITGGIYSLVDFHGYKNSDSNKKILRNIFRKGDTIYRSNDIMVRDELGYIRFKDRAALNYRWKGENISAIEVENTISRILDLKDVAAYGVKIPGADGYPGMVTIADAEDAINLDQLLVEMKQKLPSYAIPLFIRKTKEIETTGTYKTLKKMLQQEAYDIRKASKHDKFFFLLKGKYINLDEKLYDEINGGRIAP